ncbi:MAG: tRNA pseudouridine(13) synthase TruD [Phycisphaerae bacterium]|jgi:tRNA pseudouridine13 synthase
MSGAPLSLPRVLTAFEPVPGAIKLDYEDFEVEEIPLYDFSGEGTHACFQVEKRGLTTAQAAHDIARVLGVRRRDIGFAGLKDARAVTRQWMSVEHVDADKLMEIDLPRLRVLRVTRHGNKLRLGHLRGNRFRIRVRSTDATRLADIQDALCTLTRVGVPNYFGVQRFGARGDTWKIGGAIVRGDLSEAVDLVLGRPGPRDFGAVRRARELYESGQYDEALRVWPRMYRDQRLALRALARGRGNKKRAYLALDEHLRGFYVSAYQSYLFNRLLAERLPSGLDQLQVGDLAFVHASGSVFRVEDAQREQPRAEAFEISPTGPIFGYRMTEASGAPGEMEARLLESERLSAEAFRAKHLRVKGARRALRFRPEEPGVRLGADGRGPYLELRVVLPSGCYATCLLRELFAEQQAQHESEDGEAADSA